MNKTKTRPRPIYIHFNFNVIIWINTHSSFATVYIYMNTLHHFLFTFSLSCLVWKLMTWNIMVFYIWKFAWMCLVFCVSFSLHTNRWWEDQRVHLFETISHRFCCMSLKVQSTWGTFGLLMTWDMGENDNEYVWIVFRTEKRQVLLSMGFFFCCISLVHRWERDEYVQDTPAGKWIWLLHQQKNPTRSANGHSDGCALCRPWEGSRTSRPPIVVFGNPPPLPTCFDGCELCNSLEWALVGKLVFIFRLLGYEQRSKNKRKVVMLRCFGAIFCLYSPIRCSFSTV